MKNIIKVLFLCFFFLSGIILHAQFENIDLHAKNAPDHLRYDIDKLTNYLCKPATSELEKTRAFYTWLGYNIAYDVKTYKDIINGKNGEIIYTENFLEYDKNMINKALQNKKAVCQGYALIFEEMCSIAGIQSFLISGYSKNIRGESSRIGDHAWNVAFVDGKWRLYDTTWGAGNLVNDKYFEQEFNEEYFDTTPKKMILNHLPNDPIWQLLPNPITYETFIKEVKIIKFELQKPTPYPFAYNDSIQKLLSYPKEFQALISAENAFRFNPKNAEDLGYAWNNVAVQFSNKSIRLDAARKPIYEILEANLQAIEAQKKAVFYTNDDKLREGLGIFYMNHSKFLQDKGYNEALDKNYDAALASYNNSLEFLRLAAPIFGNNKSLLEAEGTSQLNLGFIYSSMANDRINWQANFERASFHFQKAKKILNKAGTSLAKQNLRVVEQNLRAIEQNKRVFAQ